MTWVLILVLFPALAFASDECATQFNGKCRDVCTSDERPAQAIFGCSKNEKCCIKKSSAKKLKRVSGRVTAIDRGEKSITLEGITLRADEAMLANIKEGDTVTVDYYTRDVHRAISVLPEVK